MSATSRRPVLLVVAKAPVPGLAKTRLAPAFGDVGAARLAHAALLDTLDASVAAAAEAGADVAVALTGRVCDAIDPHAIVRALAAVEVVGQRGGSFADRLANAHADTARGRPVLQIGMDTPQVDASLLGRLLAEAAHPGAGLGRATDGGWWALALPRGEDAACLRSVPMSRPDTADCTANALRGRGIGIRELDVLTDVDGPDDVTTVVPQCTGRFGAVARELLGVAS